MLHTLKILGIIVLIGIAFMLESCGKEISEGAKIKGKILSIGSNNDSTYVENESVYLVSKTDSTFQLKRKSGKKGGFKFKNVPAGEYALIIYSNRKNEKTKDSCLVQTIVVDKNQEFVKLDPIVMVPRVEKNY